MTRLPMMELLHGGSTNMLRPRTAEVQDLMTIAQASWTNWDVAGRRSVKTDLTLNEEAIRMIASHSPGRRGLAVLAIFWRIGTGRRNSAADLGAENR